MSELVMVKQKASAQKKRDANAIALLKLQSKAFKVIA